MVEVTYPNNEVVFEADIFFKDALGTKEKSWGQFDIVFRGERYHLITH
jgi:arylsulfate sulfotransferase